MKERLSHTSTQTDRFLLDISVGDTGKCTLAFSINKVQEIYNAIILFDTFVLNSSFSIFTCRFLRQVLIDKFLYIFECLVNRDRASSAKCSGNRIVAVASPIRTTKTFQVLSPNLRLSCYIPVRNDNNPTVWGLPLLETLLSFLPTFFVR